MATSCGAVRIDGSCLWRLLWFGFRLLRASSSLDLSLQVTFFAFSIVRASASV